VYLYALVLGTVGWLLANAGQVLQFGLSSLLGVAPESVGNRPVLVALGEPLVNMLVYGLFWAYFWRSIGREAATEGEVGRQAGVRRVYYYLVSLVALSFLAGSVVGLLQLIADALLQATPLDPGDLRRSLAEYASQLLIALPVWLFHWSAVQRRVRADAGGEEARATSRRWYLYVVAFVAVAVLLFSAARIVYELVVAALGQPLGREEQVELAHVVISGLVAATLLWYHWWLVLRADLAALRQAGRGRAAVAVVAGLDPASVERLERFVRESFDGARVKLYWTDEAGVRETVERASSVPSESGSGSSA
jgi:hypothetical protein